jgi:hypothetical protein
VLTRPATEANYFLEFTDALSPTNFCQAEFDARFVSNN